MGGWTSFFQGELSAAAALAGLIFVAISVNQARILELGRMADRGLEALVMLFLALIVASLPLIPGQPIRLLGAEILAITGVVQGALTPLQSRYIRATDALYRRGAVRMTWSNRAVFGLIALAGLTILWRGDDGGLYLLAAGILLSFIAAGAHAWVLLIEINR